MECNKQKILKVWKINPKQTAVDIFAIILIIIQVSKPLKTFLMMKYIDNNFRKKLNRKCFLYSINAIFSHKNSLTIYNIKMNYYYLQIIKNI